MSSGDAAQRRETAECRKKASELRKGEVSGWAIGGRALLALGSLAGLAVGWYHLLWTWPGLTIFLGLAVLFATSALGEPKRMPRKRQETPLSQNQVVLRRETPEYRLAAGALTLLGVGGTLLAFAGLAIWWYHLLFTHTGWALFIALVGLIVCAWFDHVCNGPNRPPADSEGLGFWGHVGAVVVGFGIASLFFGDD